MIITDPFPHIVITDALDPEDYKDLFLAWEVAEVVTETHHRKKENRIPRQEFAWKAEFAGRLMQEFGIEGEPTIGRFMLRRTGYVLPPHADPSNFKLTVLHYMPSKESRSGAGTDLYRGILPDVPDGGGARYTKNYEYATQVRFKPNTVLAFLNSDISIHGLSRLKQDRLAYQWHIK